MRNLLRRLAITFVFTCTLQVIGSTIVLAQDWTSFNVSKNRVREIEGLLQELRAASERELTEGQTAVDKQGKRVFTGQSATKMARLHDETLKRIDFLIARPEVERRAATLAISNLIGDQVVARALSGNGQPITYQHTAKSSYNRDVPVEIYYVDSAQFEVDVRNNDIIQFGPRPLTELGQKPIPIDFTNRFSPNELAKIARKFVSRHVGAAVLEDLEAETSDKEGLIYFFRWEDKSREVEGVRPFIQVALSRSGELVSFTNSLSLPDSHVSSPLGSAKTSATPAFARISFLSPQPTLATFQTGVTIFANNGNYFTQYGPSNWWWTQSGEGYCSTRIASWCNPKYMRYTYESLYATNYATWCSPYYGWGTHKVFIPRVNATTRWGNYDINYNGGSDHEFSIDQLVYSDAWVPTYTLYNIGCTWLYDSMWGFQSPTGKKVGFDEIQIVY